MADIFKLKTAFMTPFIRFLVKHPDLMHSRLFLKAMRVFPEKVSKTYDEKIAQNIIEYQMALLTGLNQINNKPQKILDLCTGTGFAAFMAIEHFPNASVDALDQSSEMIKIAKEKAVKNSVSRIHFNEGNAAELDYDDDIFDLVITSNAPIYLSEAVRVLKISGLILISFSFSGEAFVKAKKNISAYLVENNIMLLEIENIGKGAYILGQKLEKTQFL